MAEHEGSTHQHDNEVERDEQKEKHEGAASGALLGTVAIGPLGAPIGAAAGELVDRLIPDADDPPKHTHDLDAPCYDGCPAWHSAK